jgi:hypothetical protein
LTDAYDYAIGLTKYWSYNFSPVMARFEVAARITIAHSILKKDFSANMRYYRHEWKTTIVT